METKIYRGVVILKVDKNSSGIKWQARNENGDHMRADTLQGIKKLIKFYELVGHNFNQ